MNIKKQFQIEFKALLESDSLRYQARRLGDMNKAAHHIRNVAIDIVVDQWVKTFPDSLYHPKMLGELRIKRHSAMMHVIKIDDFRDEVRNEAVKFKVYGRATFASFEI